MSRLYVLFFFTCFKIKYVYKSNEKMKITFFLKYVFCISFLSVYTKHVLKHYDTLLYLKPNEKIQQTYF
jgi:hypothetical protein